MEEQAISARRLQKSITKPLGEIGKGHNDDIISSYYNSRHHILFTAGGDFDKSCKQWLCNIVFHDGRWKLMDLDSGGLLDGSAGYKYTEPFMSPELAKAMFDENGKKVIYDEKMDILPHIDKCSNKIDVWGLGVVLYTLCSNQYGLIRKYVNVK